ncbi:MAG: hypothetical protein VB130_11080 [Clostridium sp.]|nr:hypothetical protein [Clostridium sp.]
MKFVAYMQWAHKIKIKEDFVAVLQQNPYLLYMKVLLIYKDKPIYIKVLT